MLVINIADKLCNGLNLVFLAVVLFCLFVFFFRAPAWLRDSLDKVIFPLFIAEYSERSQMEVVSRYNSECVNYLPFSVNMDNHMATNKISK